MKTIFKLFAIISLCLSASCTHEEIPTVQEDGKKHTCIMDVAVTLAGYDGSTRSDGESQWENGDRMYITFYSSYGETATGVAEYFVEESAWVLSYTGTLATDGNNSCLVRFFKNATHDGESVYLTPHSISYRSSDATYMYDGNTLRVSAYLTPSTGRIYFASQEDAEFTVSGLTYNTRYTLAGDAMETSSDPISQAMHSRPDGTGCVTDYIYAAYTDTVSRSLDIRVQSLIFSKSFPAEMLQASASGYITLPTSQSHNGWDVREAYEYVDLGLPSGLKWATCNVGAANPWESGGYYAWGEIEEKSEYTEDNSVAYGAGLGDISGNAEYDAARANWGGEWRMPTSAECEELLNYCTWEWSSQNGTYGYFVNGNNGNRIFLPVAGYRYGSTHYFDGPEGHYWTSTPNDTYNALKLSIGAVGSEYRTVDLGSSAVGRNIRPVMSGQAVEEVFALGNTELYATSSATAFGVGVNSNVAWSAEVSANWVKLVNAFADWTSTNTNQDGTTSQYEYTFNVAAGNTLSFDWAVSSETNYDWLTITLNGEQIVRQSGEASSNFTRTFDASGTYTLVVTYSKDGSQSNGSDTGRIFNMGLSNGSATTIYGNNSSNLEISVDDNFNSSSRTAAVVFRRSSDNGELGTITVTQEGAQEYFTLETNYFTVGYHAESYTIGVNSNIDWYAEASESWLRPGSAYADWTSDNHEHGSESRHEYVLDVTAGSTLSFDWAVSSETSFDWLTITLNGEQIVRQSGEASSNFTRTFDASGSYTLVVSYSKDGSASVGDDMGRIYNISLSGATSSQFVFVVDDNTSTESRSAVITFRRRDNGGELGTVTVTQDGSQGGFQLGTNRLVVGYSAAAYSVDVNSSFSWYTSTSADWLTFGNSFNDWISSNHGDSSESSYSYYFNVPVGCVLNFDWAVSSEGGCDWLTITLDGEQLVRESGENSNHVSKTIETSDLHTLTVSYTKDVSVANGEDLGRIFNISFADNPNALYVIGVGENSSTESRSAVVTFYRSDNDSELGFISVDQNGKTEFFNIVANSLDFSHAASDHTFNIDTNIDWYVETSGAWVGGSKFSMDCLSVSCEENNSVSARTGTLTIRRTDNSSELATITVTQAGRYLNVNHNRIELASDGGESYAVTIDAAGEYAISQSGDWFTVNRNTDNTFTITAAAYSDADDRTGTITVELTGLPDGESMSVTIEVVQYAKDVSVDVDGFEEEKEWN